MGKLVKHSEETPFSSDDIARIQYQCRRGMLELDVFLMPFCANCFEGLPANQKVFFVELLEEPDPDLFTWLMGYGEAKQQYSEIVRLIRTHQLSASSN